MKLGCVDETNGATDTGNDGCNWYEAHPNTCGNFDDEDFRAYPMCCACKQPGKF